MTENSTAGEGYTAPVTVLLTPSMKARVVDAARRQGMAASTLVRQLVFEEYGDEASGPLTDDQLAYLPSA